MNQGLGGEFFTPSLSNTNIGQTPAGVVFQQQANQSQAGGKDALGQQAWMYQMGQAPNMGINQLNQGVQQSQAMNQAMAASGRGQFALAGGAHGAMQQNAAMAQQGGAQADILRQQQMQAAQQMQLAQANQLRQGDLESASQMAQLAQQQGNINTGQAINQAQQNNQMWGSAGQATTVGLGLISLL